MINDKVVQYLSRIGAEGITGVSADNLASHTRITMFGPARRLRSLMTFFSTRSWSDAVAVIVLS